MDTHIWFFINKIFGIEYLPLIEAACQILRACLSGAGSIAERTPGQNKEIRIDTFIHINADGNTDTVKDKDTDDKDKK